MRNRLASRLVNWFMINFMFAVLPLAMALLIRSWAGSLSIEALSVSPEILFLCLILSAMALADLSEIRPPQRLDVACKMLRYALLLGAVVSAILYGVLLHDCIVAPGRSAFRMGLMKFAIGMTAVFIVVSTIAECVAGYIEQRCPRDTQASIRELEERI